MQQIKVTPKYVFVNNQHLTEEQIKTELLTKPTKLLFVNEILINPKYICSFYMKTVI